MNGRHHPCRSLLLLPRQRLLRQLQHHLLNPSASTGLASQVLLLLLVVLVVVARPHP
jgi:hypothetical protein